MSNTINVISHLKHSDDISVSELANTILKDYALTSKILKLVNSAHYGHIGEVTTISRAIVVLGFDNIKNMALSLIFFDQLQKNKGHAELASLTLKSLYSSILAKKIAEGTNFVNKEEAFICTLFHTLGQVMTAYYLPERYEELVDYSRNKEVPETTAALAVLGVSFEEIGIYIAREWHFPTKIILSMRNIRNSEIVNNANEVDRLCSLSTFSHEIAGIIATDISDKEKEYKFAALVKTFTSHFGSIGKDLNNLILSAMIEMTDYSSALDFYLNDSVFAKQALRWTISQEIKKIETGSLSTINGLINAKKEVTPGTETIFTKGVQDINRAIINNDSLNDTIMIVLETIYSGMKSSGISKVIFFEKDLSQSSMNIRLGFGEGIENAKKWFMVPIGEQNDIFNLALLKQNDLVIRDIFSSEISHLLPDWYKTKLSSPIFVIIMPIAINKLPLGLFYLEGDIQGFKNITAGHLNYLKILRDQTILSLKQKQD